MREIARVQQGFFPTQDRIVRAVASLFKLPTAAGPIVVLDASCGTGKAIHDLRNHWLAQYPTLRVSLLGIVAVHAVLGNKRGGLSPFK